MIRQLPRIFDLLTSLSERFPDKNDILCVKASGNWIKYSVKEYASCSRLLSYAMIKLGYMPGDKAITLSSNRPEWNITDMGISMAGMVHVPVYPTLSKEDMLYIFDHSEAKVIFVDSESMLEKIAPLTDRMKSPARVIVMDNSEKYDCMEYLYRVGKESEEEFSEKAEKIRESIKTTDLASIIYTSGTTGTPKGVMLSHQNIMFNAYAHAIKQTITYEQKMMSFLPLCHIYERSMNYEYQYLGISIYYAESIGTIARDMAECHPNGFCAVPRVLEMMYDKLEAAGKNLTGIKKRIYNMAWKFGNNYDNYNHGFFYTAIRNLYDKMVYCKWREAFGGNEMLIVSGGSSIHARIIRLFNAARLHIFEGYGMTETSPVIAVNSPAEGYNVIGTVGKPLEGTVLKIADDGEILTKGPHVMIGYYKDHQGTSEVIDEEGFMHTGDIGEISREGFLRITDRKKEIFKLSLGKYIAPQMIENMLRESPFIANCIVIGENQKFVSAIITPNISRLHYWAAKHDVTFRDNSEMLDNPKIIAKIHKEVEKVNAGLAPHEHIKRERIVFDEWNTGNNMLSQTLKLKRANIKKRYGSIIKEIYKL